MTWNRARINLSKAVQRLSIDEDVVVENPSGPGMRIAGRWVNAPAVTAGVTASVQQPDGETLRLLPEGLRVDDTIEVYSTSEIRPMQRVVGKTPSVIHWQGGRYKVEILDDNYENARYWRAVCTRVDQ